MKRVIERRFPRLAALYRLARDRAKAAGRRRRMTPFGFEMAGVPGMAESRFDSGEVPLLLELLESCEVFVDVGANCGVFTLAARRQGARCVAIEPNVDNLQLLLSNLEYNQCRDVEVFPLALSREPNVLPLFGGGEGASLERNWGGMNSTYSRLAPVNTLDNLCGSRFVGQRMLIKIDVEGHEFDVLEGADSLIRREPAPVWLLEHGFRENFGEGVNPHFREVFELFWNAGYRCLTADPARREVQPADVDRWMKRGQRDFGYLNYVMIKRDVPDVPAVQPPGVAQC